MLRLPALLTAALAATLLAGCGVKQSPTAPGGRTIKFLSMDYDSASSAVQKRIVDDFNRQSKDGQVQIDIVAWNDGHQKLQTLISGNQSPDIAIVGTRWMNEYADAGLLADLSDPDVTGIALEDFIPSVLDTGRVNGKLVGLPCAASVRGLYYNADMLAKAGVKPPKTWAELETACRKVQAANPGVNGIGIQGKEVETDLYYYYFLWGAGGEILGKDGKCALASPAGEEALAFETSLVKNGLSEPSPTGYTREGLQDLFKARKIAMVITGPFFAGMLRKDVPDLKYGITEIPGKTGPVFPAVTDVMVAFDKSPNKDLAHKFLAFWYKDANRLAWDAASGMLPEKSTVAADPKMTADKNRAFFMKALPKGRYVPTHPKWEQMSVKVCDAVQSALLGQATPEDALKKAAADVDKVAAGG
ncbi:MAG TPA: sugar ABC transporter substrate-binding protein [Armatimonadota bacterium]|jgi:multiple sugar transport system substrate-binding protein